MTYDRAVREATLRWIFQYPEMELYDGLVPWEGIAELYDPLSTVLSRIVGGPLCLDQRSHGLAVGWDRLLSRWPVRAPDLHGGHVS